MKTILVVCSSLFASLAFSKPIMLSGGVMFYEKTSVATCAFSKKSVMFNIPLSTYKIDRVEDVSLDGPQADALSLELSLKELGNPSKTRKGAIVVEGTPLVIAGLRAKLSLGQRVYVTTDPQCVSLVGRAGGVVPSAVSKHSLVF